MKNTLNAHRNPIGFKVTDNKVAIYEQANSNDYSTQTNDLNFEQLMKIKGMEKAIAVIQDYFSSHKFPLVEDRDKFFIEKLKDIKRRFFELI
jgi:hypothetical protein